MRPFRDLLSTSAWSAPALAAVLLAAPMTLAPVSPAHAQIGIGLNITLAPPALPVYAQPPLPAPGYLWTPGYWAYGEAGYYWVPGTWVLPPRVGVLWTPGYWGYTGGVYAFNAGYWGPHVGFYGGINYGFGYGGAGFLGGEWRGGGFAYNSAVNNFGGVHVTNVYNRTVINNNVTNISYNGPHGIEARPRPEELAAAREQHVQPTPLQQQHVQLAARNPDLRASVNHGTPAIAATARPAEFKGPGVIAGRPAGTPLPHPGEGAAASRPGEAHPTAAEQAGRNPALRTPGSTPHAAGLNREARPTGAPRPMNAPGQGGPREPGSRPMGMGAPHPGGIAGPRPMQQHPQIAPRSLAPRPMQSHSMQPGPMQQRPMQPHPMAPRPMPPRPAPHPAGGGGPRPGPHHG